MEGSPSAPITSVPAGDGDSDGDGSLGHPHRAQDMEFQSTTASSKTPEQTAADGRFRQRKSSSIRTQLMKEDSDSERSNVPFVGNVCEENTNSSSWIFPNMTNDPHSNIAPPQEDIAFVPPSLQEDDDDDADDIQHSDEEGAPPGRIPQDGSFVGDPDSFQKAIRKVHSEEDISFVPPSLDGENGGATQVAAAAAVATVTVTAVTVPKDGSFRMDRKINPSLSNDSRNSVSDGKNATKSPSHPEEDISFVPSLQEEEEEEDSNDATTSAIMVPKDGSFRMDRKINPSLSNDSRDIDFAPAGSAMETAPPPRRGFYEEGRHTSPKRDATHRDINVNPDTAGKNMPTSPPPQQGSYLGQHDGSFEKNSLPVHNSAVPDQEINFSPGGSEMQTAPPPQKGSYMERRHEMSPKRNKAQRDINVTPEKAGKNMPTSSPPRRGSFFGEHGGKDAASPSSPKDDSWVSPQAEEREINFSPGGSEMETAAPPSQGSYLEGRPSSPLRGSTTTSAAVHQEIKVIPEAAGKNMQTSPPPKQGSFRGQSAIREKLAQAELSASGDSPRNMETTLIHEDIDFQVEESSIPPEYVPEDGTFPHRIATKENYNREENDDEDESDPMRNDQGLWRTKKLWDSAMLKKQNELHASQEMKIDPDSLTESIHKLGALMGSVHQEDSSATEEGKEERKDLSDSIQKMGAVLGSTHGDDSEVQKHDDDEHEAVYLEEEPLDDEMIEPTDSDMLDDLLGDDDIDDDDEPSTSDSVVELGPLPETSHRAVNVQDDEETVHIANTSKHFEETKQKDKASDHAPDDNVANIEALLDKALDAPIAAKERETNIGSEESNEEQIVVDDDTTKMEALLDKALDAPLEEMKEAEKLGDAKEPEEEYVPNDSITKFEAFLDEALHGPLESTTDPKGKENSSDDDEPYVPDDSIARLEAFLDEALDAPLDSQEEQNTAPSEQPGTPEDSTSGLDALLDRALDDELEITFEPTEEEIERPELKEEKKSKQKQIAITSRLLRATQSVATKSKKMTPDSQSSDQSKSKKPTIPRFRGTKKARTKEQNDVTETEKSRSFMASTFAARKKNTSISEGDRNSKASKLDDSRSKKVMSKFTSWTKRANEVPMYAPAESRHKPRPAPARLFGGSSSKQKKEASTKIFDRLAKPKEQEVIEENDDLTGAPSIPSHSNFYSLSPLAQSVTSLSSQCSVTTFQSPRREGIRGCQKKFNPNLHSYRGPCELCVFFLSDKDKATLDATGRHYRVMFTAGGCCKTCQVFPRTRDDVPARLCRLCYGNSHRNKYEHTARVRRFLR